MKISYQDKIVLIGYSGCGKTTLMDYFIDGVLKGYNCIVLDPVSRFSILKNIRYSGKVQCKRPRKNKVCFKLQNEAELNALVKKLNDKDKMNAMLIVDEIDQFTRTRTMSNELSLYFQQGRNYNHGGMFSVRQVGKLNKEILSNSHYLFLFKINNKNDVQTLESITGLELDEMIKKLPKYHFYIIDLHNSESFGMFTFDKKSKSLNKINDIY